MKSWRERTSIQHGPARFGIFYLYENSNILVAYCGSAGHRCEPTERATWGPSQYEHIKFSLINGFDGWLVHHNDKGIVYREMGTVIRECEIHHMLPCYLKLNGHVNVLSNIGDIGASDA